ncbi:Rho- protein rac1a [Binucleata daphniae]
MKAYHFAFLGNKNVGKTAFITRYRNVVPSIYLPGEQQYLHWLSVQHDDGISDVILWDWMDYTMLTPYIDLSLTYSSVIYICYCVSDPSSLADVNEYLQYVNRQKQVVILLGMKIDLRNNFVLNNCLKYEDGYLISEKYGFDGFAECSALDDINCLNALSLGIELESRKNQNIIIGDPYYKKIIKMIIISVKTFLSACFSSFSICNNKK